MVILVVVYTDWIVKVFLPGSIKPGSCLITIKVLSSKGPPLVTPLMINRYKSIPRHWRWQWRRWCAYMKTILPPKTRCGHWWCLTMLSFASTDLAIESNDTSDVALKSPVSILFRGQHIYHQFKVYTLTMKSTSIQFAFYIWYIQ